MKKTYQKPVLEQMAVEQENMMATSSMNIFNEEMGASDALSNEEADINVWEFYVFNMFITLFCWEKSIFAFAINLLYK